MAVARIDDLDIHLETDRPTQKTCQLRSFVPLEVRARDEPKALLATGMIDDVRRNAERFVAVGIVVWNDPDISRGTDTGIEGARS
jgi:hypothetical protein